MFNLDSMTRVRVQTRASYTCMQPGIPQGEVNSHYTVKRQSRPFRTIRSVCLCEHDEWRVFSNGSYVKSGDLDLAYQDQLVPSKVDNVFCFNYLCDMDIKLISNCRTCRK